jgi:hypothetical protein
VVVALELDLDLIRPRVLRIYAEAGAWRRRHQIDLTVPKRQYHRAADQVMS